MRIPSHMLGSSVPPIDRLINPQPTFTDRMKGFGSFLADTLKTGAPVVTGYFQAETARANARASQNLLPASVTDKSNLQSYAGPAMLGVGVVGALVLVGALSSKKRRR